MACLPLLALPCGLQGAVLLAPSLQPQAASQFEAVLVLLGGHWPARGLLSGEGGRWQGWSGVLVCPASTVL